MYLKTHFKNRNNYLFTLVGQLCTIGKHTVKIKMIPWVCSNHIKGSKMIDLPQHLSNTLVNCPIIPCLRWLWLRSEASTLAISIWWWECDLAHLCLCHLKSTTVSSLCLVFFNFVFSSCVYPQWLFPWRLSSAPPLFLKESGHSSGITMHSGGIEFGRRPCSIIYSGVFHSGGFQNLHWNVSQNGLPWNGQEWNSTGICFFICNA